MADLCRLMNKNGNITIYVRSGDGKPLGTLVCVHGGPGGDHRGNAGIFDEIAERCIPRGYNIVQFDMYGTGESDGEARAITLESQIIDYESVLSFSHERFGGPLHVVGESMGATIAALRWNPEIASYILLWPAFDLADTDLSPYLSNQWAEALARDGYLQDKDIVLGREFIEQVKFWDFTHCFTLPSSPSLLVHGKADTAVPFEQSVRAIRSAQGACILCAHPSGDHGLQRPDERDFTHRAISMWLTERLWIQP